MAFHPETKILTRRGWKYIRELSGRDRVLVRNFLGEAEFIQPFALKKSHYEGEMIRFGSTYWAATTTPGHKVEYTDGIATAEEAKVDKHKHISRKFRYIQDDKTSESIMLYGEVSRRVPISDEDWYTIVAFTIASGYISKDKNPRLKFMVKLEDAEPLTAILEFYGISWLYSEFDSYSYITVNRDNNLARKLKLFLGARKRTEMIVPGKMIYGSSQGLLRHFLRVYTNIVARPQINRPNQLQWAVKSLGLVKSMELTAIFAGYWLSVTKSNYGHVMSLNTNITREWSIVSIEKIEYSGPVYEIDLFEGLVYVTERNLPVWLSPK